MEHASEKKFPVSSKDYKLYEEVGEGVSATVYRALCVPLNQIVAIKVLDLEKCNNDLDGIRREVQTMSLIDHSNLLRAHCSFTTDHSLWVVMPYIAGGSCLHIMKSTYPEGFEEPVIATLLREVLKALAYLHSHGHIHRDVKAGNILIDGNGSVKLADFGVSACMFDSGDRQRSRNTFVGTPCWMAPEVMQQLHGYDFKADIWSFGITALELAHGHAPFSKYPPMKVLLMTLQNAPPGLDYERDKRFSKSFKELVAACLVKDPKKRPSAEKLLKHSFFKHGKTNDYLTRTILNGLSPLGDRFRRWKAKEADLLVNNKIYADKEQKSQSEYIRGISGWNFNLEDLRSKATLINDDDEISSLDHIDVNREPKNGLTNNDDWKKSQHEEKDIQEAELVKKVESLDLLRHGNLSSSFPVHPIEALRGYFDVCEDEINAISPEQEDNCEAIPEQLSQVHKTQLREDEEIKETNREKVERNSALSTHTSSVPGHGQRFLSGSLIPERVYAQSRVTADGERDDLQQNERNYSGPLFYRQKRNGGDLQSSASMDSIGDACEGKFIQHKGRFKVTSADVSLKAVSSTSCLLSHNYGPSSCTISSSTLPTLQSILQQNILQRDQIMKVLKCVERAPGNHIDTSLVVGDEIPVNPLTSREQELQDQVNHLQHRINTLVEELQELKTKNFELEKQMKVPHGIEEER